MKKEDFDKLVNNLKTQDIRMTANPLFCVQVRNRTYGLDQYHHYDGYTWLGKNDCEGNWDDPTALHEYIADTLELSLVELDEKLDEAGIFITECDEFEFEGLSFEKCFYEERWDFDTAHLTEKGAEEYLATNRHNLTEPRIYVTSQYRCWEWNALREALMNGELVLKEV